MSSSKALLEFLSTTVIWHPMCLCCFPSVLLLPDPFGYSGTRSSPFWRTTSAALSQAVVHLRRALQHTWRTYFLFSPGSDQELKVVAPVMAPSTPPPLIFVFTGQGPQHISMGKRLFHTYHTFRQTVLEMDAIYQSLVGVSLVDSTVSSASCPPRFLMGYGRSTSFSPP